MELNSEVLAAIIGVAGALAGVLAGAWITNLQQRQVQKQELNNLVNLLSIELDEQSTSILYGYEFLRRMRDGMGHPAAVFVELQSFLPIDPQIFLSNINKLQLLNPRVSSYLVQCYADVRRAKQLSSGLTEELRNNKARTVSSTQIELLFEKWKDVCFVGSLAIGRLLEHHSQAIDQNVRDLLEISERLLDEAHHGILQWNMPGDVVGISLKKSAAVQDDPARENP